MVQQFKYSQNNEELVIEKYFKDYLPIKRRFLDIGAYDGIQFSNTFRLILNGWSGISVEPSSLLLPILKANYQRFPDIQIIEEAIGDKEEEKEFFETHDAVSTFSTEWKTIWEKSNVKYENKRIIKILTFEQLINRVGNDFSFISIDIEQNNFNVFKTIDFSKLPNLQCFCIEHDGHADEIKELMKPLNFFERARNPENIILGKQ